MKMSKFWTYIRYPDWLIPGRFRYSVLYNYKICRWITRWHRSKFYNWLVSFAPKGILHIEEYSPESYCRIRQIAQWQRQHPDESAGSE